VSGDGGGRDCAHEPSIGTDPEPVQRPTALRASDADRKQIVSALRQHHAEGRGANPR
jgi:hypothetical protein